MKFLYGCKAVRIDCTAILCRGCFVWETVLWPFCLSGERIPAQSVKNSLYILWLSPINLLWELGINKDTCVHGYSKNRYKILLEMDWTCGDNGNSYMKRRLWQKMQTHVNGCLQTPDPPSAVVPVIINNSFSFFVCIEFGGSPSMLWLKCNKLGRSRGAVPLSHRSYRNKIINLWDNLKFFPCCLQQAEITFRKNMY